MSRLSKVLVVASSLTGAGVTAAIGFDMLKDYPILQVVFAATLLWLFAIVPIIYLREYGE